jgi:hypothetical protein
MVNNAIILQHSFANANYNDLARFSFPLHLKYCEQHGVDYRFEFRTFTPVGDWDSVYMIQNAIYDYDYVAYIDTDAIIFNQQADIRDACIKPINVVHYEIPFKHFNTGVMFFKGKCNETKDFIKDWLKGFPGTERWAEQGVFNDMYPRYTDVIHTLGDEWNSSKMQDVAKDPVIVAFHGDNDAATRLHDMKIALGLRD